ncbi:MAG TPA: helix-turn-helix domain-containing protein, partial [Spirochaetales bacterium]|nr:helix-turn-helix domain-containing protein [Spirochaetales bacterium]
MGRTKKIVDKSVVLEASLDLIEREGIEAFSTRRLAARLRISAMTLYNYYENREAILREVALRGLSDFLASLAAELGRHPEVGRAPLLAYKLLAAEFMRLGKERPRLYLFLFDSGLEELRRDPEVAKYYGHLLEG